jgi:hypothetical protein
MHRASPATIAIATAIIVAALLSLNNPALGAASGRTRPDLGRGPGPCHLAARPRETVQHHMKRLITCAVGLWPVRGGATRAICIARRESGLDPRASSRTGRYLGLYQHQATAWPSRFDTWTRPGWKLKADALNGRSNAIVTIRMVNANGWGPWAGVGC